MRNKRYRKRSYKFTGKKFSKRGLLSTLIASAALIALGVTVRISFANRGCGTVYLGSVGLLSTILSLVSVGVAVWGIREEDTFKLMPGIGLLLGILSSLIWIGIYIMGCI